MSSEPIKYRYGDELLTKLEIIRRASLAAEGLSPETKKFYLDMTKQAFTTDNMKNKLQSIFLPAFGVVFLVGIIVLSLLNPFPSMFQSATLWVALCLAASACAALIPGFVEFRLRGLVRAGGAIAIFCIMYFEVPAIASKIGSQASQHINIFMAQAHSATLQKLSPEFDLNSHRSVTSEVTGLINQYYGTNWRDSDFTFYRKSDGKIYSTENCSDVTEYDVLAVPNSLEKGYKNKRDAYISLNAKASR